MRRLRARLFSLGGDVHLFAGPGPDDRRDLEPGDFVPDFRPGQDVRAYQLATLQPQIGFVLQHAVLFRATVRENIAYGRPEATDAEIVAAAEAADAHCFIAGLPLGYDAPTGLGTPDGTGGF